MSMAARGSSTAKWVAMHLVSPRTLLFLHRDDHWLLLLGAPRKWFAGRLNGLGGHVEPGEGVMDGARREAFEETGLQPISLELAAIIHTIEDPPCVLFVAVGRLPPGELRPTDEGDHVWLTLRDVADPTHPVLDDVRALLPAVAARPSGAPILSYTLTPPSDLRRDV